MLFEWLPGMVCWPRELKNFIGIGKMPTVIGLPADEGA
jgi:hypothetical protein